MRRPRLTRPAVTLTVLALVVAASAAGCGRITFNGENNHSIGSAPYTEGSGKVVTVTRALEDFTSVSVENGVTVFVRHGSASKVDVKTDDNLTGFIATDVRDGKLTITVTGSITTHNEIRLDVTSAREIAAVGANNGSTIDTEDVTAAQLDASVNNGSTLRAGGKTTALRLEVNNGSTGDLTNVEARTADVSVNNGSTAKVNASETVTGSCYSGSTLKVKGSASTAGLDKDASSTVN